MGIPGGKKAGRRTNFNARDAKLAEGLRELDVRLKNHNLEGGGFKDPVTLRTFRQKFSPERDIKTGLLSGGAQRTLPRRSLTVLVGEVKKTNLEGFKHADRINVEIALDIIGDVVKNATSQHTHVINFEGASALIEARLRERFPGEDFSKNRAAREASYLYALRTAAKLFNDKLAGSGYKLYVAVPYFGDEATVSSTDKKGKPPSPPPVPPSSPVVIADPFVKTPDKAGRTKMR